MLTVGGREIACPVSLAPMAGVADSAFRQLCKEFGCGLLTGEMVSAKALTMSDRKTKDLLRRAPIEAPFAIQLFGDDPEIMARAAELVMAWKPDFIDINMGCPAPKIAGNGSGSSLMKNPPLAAAVVRAVVAAVEVPVTVKIRKGWDEHSVNAVEVALLCQEAGAAAVAVHGKTREQMYAPPVDRAVIRQVKEALSVPVIGNGEIDSPEAAAQMFAETSCDGIMVGRGALGRPWLFAQINEYLQTGEVHTRPTPRQKMACLLRQAELAIAHKGEKRAMAEMRKHAAWYFKGGRGASKLRAKAGTLTTYQALEEMTKEALDLGCLENG